MRVNFRAIEDYGQGSQTTRAMGADKVELIQMLFDGLTESMLNAKGHIEVGAIEEKTKAWHVLGELRLDYKRPWIWKKAVIWRATCLNSTGMSHAAWSLSMLTMT